MAEQLPSIVDVAQRAGVSVATASRVMSSSTYPVSAATRQKVLQAAQELNYVPNSLARSLKAQRSKLIAVIVGDNADPYFAQIARGVEEIANANGYLTIICNTDRELEREYSYLKTLQDYRADGIIFAGSGYAQGTNQASNDLIAELVHKIQARGAAVITLSQHTLPVPSIQPDNFQGARDITTHLINQGHRRIAIVTGPTNLVSANLRLQGYMTAFAQANITTEHTLLIPGNFTQTGGEQAAQAIASLPPAQRPTAIFATNDETAFGILTQLQRLHIRVPQDISLCGFGDLPMASMLTPALTTVHIGLKELGRAGALRILAQLNKEEVPQLELLPTTIRDRATTAPPPITEGAASAQT
jgi:LacI family transcriptional regulator